MGDTASFDFNSARRSVRLLALLDFSEKVGRSSVHVSQLHVMAYLSDVLAPVWNLPSIDEQVLKRLGSPFFPRLQRSLDYLVGAGMVVPEDVSYRQSDDQSWYLDARYSINRTLAAPALGAMEKHSGARVGGDFVREVVYAVSGLGSDGLAKLSVADAAYSSSMTDVGGIIDVEGDGAESNLSARVALHFQEILGDDKSLSAAEMTHLYIRHLYSRIASV